MSSPRTPALRVAVHTPRAAGAVGILHIAGPRESLNACLADFTPGTDWQGVALGRSRLCNLADLDEGLVTLLTTSAADTAVAQVTPHGGLALIDALVARLLDLGCVSDPQPTPTTTYPEATSPIEADALAAIADAASPAAIPVLAAQPAIWRAWHQSQAGAERSAAPGIPVSGTTTPANPLPPTTPLRHLLTPPTLVLLGRPNVGKSTLLNALTRRDAAIASPIAGTTRDHLTAETLLQLETPNPKREAPDAHNQSSPVPTSDFRLSTSLHTLAVHFLDTPGLRTSDDPIEQRAIAAARSAVQSADLLIAVRDPDTDFPDPAATPRPPDLRLLNKADLLNPTALDLQTFNADLAVSAATRAGLAQFTRTLLDRLGLPDLADPLALPPWPFNATLQRALADPAFDWPAYLGIAPAESR
ncbi:MAG: GTPase [Planctomycetota bacterium]